MRPVFFILLVVFSIASLSTLSVAGGTCIAVDGRDCSNSTPSEKKHKPSLEEIESYFKNCEEQYDGGHQNAKTMPWQDNKTFEAFADRLEEREIARKDVSLNDEEHVPPSVINRKVPQEKKIEEVAFKTPTVAKKTVYCPENSMGVCHSRY